MAHSRSRLKALAALGAALLLAGCPNPPVLQLSTYAIAFGDNANERDLSLRNSGAGSLNWSIQEVQRASEEAPWIDGDVPWLSVQPATGATTTNTSRVVLTASRTGQTAGLYNNTGIRVSSNGGTQVIPVSLTVAPVLSVSPSAVAVSPAATSASFTVANSGPDNLVWDVLLLPNINDRSTARPLAPGDGITVRPNPGTTGPRSSTAVAVEFLAGRENFALLVTSSGGEGVVQFRFGATLEGLAARPSPITLYVDNTPVPDGNPPLSQVPSELTIENTGAVNRNWSLEIADIVDPQATPSISVSQVSGSTSAGGTTVVDIGVIDASKVTTGSGFYQLLLRSGESFQIIPITIEVLLLPEIALSEPPQLDSPRPEIVPITLLDLGRESVQGTFYIANVGPRGSRLYFQIEHDDQGAEDPLIIDVNPLLGNANAPDNDFFHPDFPNFYIDGAPIVVTVDRTNLKEDVEFRTITVRAYNEDQSAPLDVVDVATLQVRVERQPLTIEGAANRTRPPSMMRFVFSLRDSLGKAIPTQTREELERIAFRVLENDEVLDPNETGIKISQPKSGYGDGDLYFHGNLILMLDYTNSMRLAGTTDPTNPLAPGEAIAQVKAAAQQFLDDIPATYNVGIMYHSRRQQPNRIIHPITNDRQALKNALAAFTVPSTESLQSDIRDAVAQAIDLLASQNTDDTLPFDDADVNGVLFITDGRDNSSTVSASEVSQLAQDNLVRLFPLTYSAGSPSNLADLIVLGSETGGHFYNSTSVAALTSLMATERGLALTTSTQSTPDAAFFRIINRGDTTLTWNIAPTAATPWITGFVPNGGTLTAGSEATVRIQLDPASLGLNASAEATVDVTSNVGNAQVTVRVTTGAIAQDPPVITTTLRDEPGIIWNELNNQIILTYNTPQQSENSYLITATYTDPAGESISGSFQRDAVFSRGVDIAGQVSLRTLGLLENPNAALPGDAVRAEVYVYADYVPTRISQFRFRFFLRTPGDLPVDLVAPAQAALDQATLAATIAPNGLLSGDDTTPAWRLIDEGDGRFLVLTEQALPLPYNAFGNLLQLNIGNLAAYSALFDGRPEQPAFLVEMRMDNDLYFAPATPTRPSETRYFLYPAGATFPGETLVVSSAPDIAQSAADVVVLQQHEIDPEAPSAWDRDEDLLADFDDPSPDDADFPGPLSAPDEAELVPGQSTLQLTVRNQRLDTFTYTWKYTEADLPAGALTLNGVAPDAVPAVTLAPGQTATVTLNVNRAGLPEGIFRDELELVTDLFGTEIVPVTVVVVL